MLILFEQLNPFLDFFSRALLFLPNCRSICLSMHLTLCNFQCIALEPEILWKLERWFASAFHKLLFPCCARFAWIWTYKAHDLTDHQLTVGSFLPTNLIATMASIGKDRQISRWHWYFQQLLPFLAALASFISLILLCFPACSIGFTFNLRIEKKLYIFAGGWGIS